MTLDYPAKVVSFKGFGPTPYKQDGIAGPDDSTFTKRILCEGDSWMSFGAIPSNNLLNPLRFAQPTLLINLASPGDTIRRMADVASNPNLEKLIADKKFNTKWDAIFISGGGNDLIDQAGQLICRPSEGAGASFLDYVNRIDLAGFCSGLKAGYRKIADLRRDKNEKTPLIFHIYDYPTPRDAKSKLLGVIGLSGPWLYPAFKAADIPEPFWIPITDYLFESLAKCLIEVASELENAHVIANTRETLVRARLGTTGRDGDWLNEIHPTSEGYEKLARVVSPEIQAIL